MITERIFGEIKGIEIPEVTLHNSAGMEVSILAYGATIRSVVIPTSSGRWCAAAWSWPRRPGTARGGLPYLPALTKPGALLPTAAPT